jgi:hypothetical protein
MCPTLSEKDKASYDELINSKTDIDLEADRDYTVSYN